MSAQFKPFTAVFDDGTRIDMQSSSRDLLALEKAGVVLSEIPPIEGSYQLAHLTLQRYVRLGRVPEGFEAPATAQAFMDSADIDMPDEDAEGNGSGQEPSTG